MIFQGTRIKGLLLYIFLEMFYAGFIGVATRNSSGEGNTVTFTDQLIVKLHMHKKIPKGY